MLLCCSRPRSYTNFMFVYLVIAVFALRYVRTREVMSSDMSLRDLYLRILDFAGQLEGYVSHRLFAQDLEALFCIVADISSPMLTVRRKTSVWCSFIGGISQQKPSVLLAMTHLDRVPACEHDGLILNLSNFVRKNHSNLSVKECLRVNYGAGRIVDCLKDIKDSLYDILKTKLKGKFVPKSYVRANACLQEESVKRNARQDSQIMFLAEVHKLLVDDSKEFHDKLLVDDSKEFYDKRFDDVSKKFHNNRQFVVRVLKYLHSTGTILFSQSNKFIVLQPYTWLTNVLSVFLPEPGKPSLIAHHCGLIMLRDISAQYKLLHCNKADVKRVMELLLEYHICIRDGTHPSTDPGYVFPALLPTIKRKVRQSYWPVSPQFSETFVGRVVTCKNEWDSISRGLFCSLQARLNNEALYEYKDGTFTCTQFRNVIIIRPKKKKITIQVTLKRKNDTFNADTIEILARGSSPLPLLHDTIRTVRHHLHHFAPNLEMLWSAVCPICMISSHQPQCKFPMHVETKYRALNDNDVNNKGSGVDISWRCHKCTTSEICLNRSGKYMHRATSICALTASQIRNGIVSDTKGKIVQDLQ